METANADMFRPPINRAMRVLDRSYFQKKIPLAAAKVLQKKQIAKCRADLTHDLLKVERVSVVRDDPVEKDQKALLLKPEIKPDSRFCSLLFSEERGAYSFCYFHNLDLYDL